MHFCEFHHRAGEATSAKVAFLIGREMVSDGDVKIEDLPSMGIFSVIQNTQFNNSWDLLCGFHNIYGDPGVVGSRTSGTTVFMLAQAQAA